MTEPTYREETRRFGMLRMVAEVRTDGVQVRVGPLPPSTRRIGLTDILGCEVATYDARTYGGWHWGMRTTPGGNTVYRLRGDQGVELDLVGGRKIFVGSQRPSELHAAITHAQRTGR